MKLVKILCLAVLMLLPVAPSGVFAQNTATTEIMNEAFFLGRASKCIPASKNTEAFGRDVGSAFAGYYMKKYPRLDRQEIFNAYISGMGFGIGEQEKKGKAECPQVINEANKILKKVGAQGRF